MPRSRSFVSRIASALVRLAHGDSGAGIILIAAAAAALIAANTSLAQTYHYLLHNPFFPAVSEPLSTIHGWINDALMAVFFFVVGLEIKREVLDGELASAARRRLPVIAALAGMALPALVYLALAGTGRPLSAGWAIPAATDIAFAVGVLALAGKRLPPSLRVFLLTVAIVDDLGAVAIIALFYTAGTDLLWSGAALATLAAMALMNRAGITRALPYVLASLLVWYCVLHSGVHPTIAGVLAAMTIPLKLDQRGDSLLLRMEHALAPWSAYLIVPLFGFANAGVELPQALADLTASPLPLALASGLFLGKQTGIFGAIWLCDKLGIAPKPSAASWTQLWGLSALCGIGFTMSLFIGALAFPVTPELVDAAKIGVLIGSGLAGLLGFVVLKLAAPKR